MSIATDSGIPEANLHQFRHSFATYLRKAGTGLADLKDLLGDEDIKTTRIYAAVEQEGLRTAVNRLAEIFSPVLSLRDVTRPENAGKEDEKSFDPNELEGEEKDLAGRQGFEPRSGGPEPPVLPLDDLPARWLF